VSTSAGPSRTPPAAARPDWVAAIESVLPHVRADQLTPALPPAGAVTRPAAVLIQFSGVDRGDADVLLIERSSTLRSHPGQAAFPGGAVDPGDGTPVAAALREAQEETGLSPGDVELLGTLPELWLPPSGFAVTPVVGWMPEPAPVRVNDPREVARVQWLRLDSLLDPRHRFRTRHPSGYIGPAFDVDGLFVWGFTAGLLSRLLDAAGLTLPWDVDRIEPLPARYLSGSRSGARAPSGVAERPPIRRDEISSPAEDDSGVEP
jgi:8-oxo-dGTP pyrophosphatase MutT (NUDIX family)